MECVNAEAALARSGQAAAFRPASARDLPRLRRWLETPEAARRWGNLRAEFELMKSDLDEPGMTMRIVSFTVKVSAERRVGFPAEESCC